MLMMRIRGVVEARSNGVLILEVGAEIFKPMWLFIVLI
jgi:hypothetical protein